MIAIEVYCKPTKNCDFVAIQNWTEFACTEYPIMFDFLQGILDQKIIINKFSLTVDGTTDLTRYYAESQEQAEIFRDIFKNVPLNFSKEKLTMEECWIRDGFEIDILLKEIDFDNEKELFDLVNKDTGEMWATTYPLHGPLSDYFQLEKQFRNYG